MDISKLIDIKDKIVEEYLYEPSFRGVGVSNNKVILFSNNVKSLGTISYADSIVIAKANFVSKSSYLLRSKFRPVVGGVSIGALNGLTGTAGGIIGNYMFSASHVVSDNPTQPDLHNPVIQPGAADGGTERDKIGNTVYYSVLKNQSDGDIGIVKLSASHEDNVYSVGYINSFTNVKPGLKVIKVGRTTGLTTGLVGTIYTDAKVFYPELGEEVLLKNQIVIFGKGFSKPGDSGSPIIFNNKYAGVLVAGDNNHTLCTPSIYIYKKLKEVS